MTPRDNFRRYRVVELEALPTKQARPLTPPLDYLVEEEKVEDLPYRYSLIRDTRPNPIPTRVAYRELVGGHWTIIPVYSISYLIDPMERAAIDANGRGDRVNSLLLLHALLEILMRSDPVAEYGTTDGFAKVAEVFKARLVDRDLPGVDPDTLYDRIRAVNEKRNDVIHSLLVRYGLEGTNARLTQQEFEVWKAAYDDTFGAVSEYVSL